MQVGSSRIIKLHSAIKQHASSSNYVCQDTKNMSINNGPIPSQGLRNKHNANKIMTGKSHGKRSTGKHKSEDNNKMDLRKRF